MINPPLERESDFFCRAVYVGCSALIRTSIGLKPFMISCGCADGAVGKGWGWRHGRKGGGGGERSLEMRARSLLGRADRLAGTSVGHSWIRVRVWG
jgi:hypothetical protein